MEEQVRKLSITGLGPPPKVPDSARSSESERLRLQEQISMMCDLSTQRSHGSARASGALSQRSKQSQEGSAGGQDRDVVNSSAGGSVRGIGSPGTKSGDMAERPTARESTSNGVARGLGAESEQRDNPQAHTVQPMESTEAAHRRLSFSSSNIQANQHDETQHRRLSISSSAAKGTLSDCFCAVVKHLCRSKDTALRLRSALEATSQDLNLRVEVLFLDGSLYVGRQENAVPDGLGVLIYPENDHSGREEYRGQFKNGQRHGWGCLRWVDGARYQGQWDRDKPSGSGLEFYKDGSVYEGQFLQDTRHGLGEYRSLVTGTYAGSWDKGVRHGPGVRIIHKSKDVLSEIIKCQYVNGKLVGKESGCRDQDLEETLKQALDQAAREVMRTKEISQQLVAVDQIVDYFLQSGASDAVLDVTVRDSAASPKLSASLDAVDPLQPTSAIEKRPTLAKLPLSNIDTGTRKSAGVSLVNNGSPSQTLTAMKTKLALPHSPSSMVPVKRHSWLEALQNASLTIRCFVRGRDLDAVRKLGSGAGQSSPQLSDVASHLESAAAGPKALSPSALSPKEIEQEGAGDSRGPKEDISPGLNEERFIQISPADLAKTKSIHDLANDSTTFRVSLAVPSL